MLCRKERRRPMKLESESPFGVVPDWVQALDSSALMAYAALSKKV